VAATLVLSDLHLGGRTGADVLRKAAVRAPLLEALDGVDRLVLLGDVLELRHGPIGEALTSSEPFFDDVAEALDPGAEVVLVAGNHDHQLIVPWLERRARAHAPAPLGLEQRITPARASWATGRLATRLGADRTTVAYPGLWLREDVYATHGHLADLYSTIPTFERSAPIGLIVTTPSTPVEPAVAVMAVRPGRSNAVTVPFATTRWPATSATSRIRLPAWSGAGVSSVASEIPGCQRGRSSMRTSRSKTSDAERSTSISRSTRITEPARRRRRR